MYAQALIFKSGQDSARAPRARCETINHRQTAGMNKYRCN